MPQSTILLETLQPTDLTKKKSTCRRALREEKYFDDLWIAHFYYCHAKRYCICGHDSDNWYEVTPSFPLVARYEKSRQE
jgi:hypothetical protein